MEVSFPTVAQLPVAHEGNANTPDMRPSQAPTQLVPSGGFSSVLHSPSPHSLQKSPPRKPLSPRVLLLSPVSHTVTPTWVGPPNPFSTGGLPSSPLLDPDFSHGPVLDFSGIHGIHLGAAGNLSETATPSTACKPLTPSADESQPNVGVTEKPQQNSLPAAGPANAKGGVLATTAASTVASIDASSPATAGAAPTGSLQDANSLPSEVMWVNSLCAAVCTTCKKIIGASPACEDESKYNVALYQHFYKKAHNGHRLDSKTSRIPLLQRLVAQSKLDPAFQARTHTPFRALGGATPLANLPAQVQELPLERGYHCPVAGCEIVARDEGSIKKHISACHEMERQAEAKGCQDSTPHSAATPQDCWLQAGFDKALVRVRKEGALTATTHKQQRVTYLHAPSNKQQRVTHTCRESLYLWYMGIEVPQCVV